MTLNEWILVGIDLIAIGILTLGIYFPRHRRKDLMVAFLVINVGVLAVTTLLASAEIAAGLGLGLFGVLSIIRLRSSEISQREVAYYFASLAMGLIAGLGGGGLLIPTALIGLIIAVIFIADHPKFLGSARQQVIKVDRAIFDEAELSRELERTLNATITAIFVQQVDLVNDSTLVDVRYRLRGSVNTAATHGDRTLTA